MEKYAEIIKAMGECAGPDCAVTCPYKDKGVRNKSCRSMLLEDAIAALAGEMADNETLNAEMDDLEAANNTLRGQRDALRLELEELKEKNRPLHEAQDALEVALKECDILHERCQVQQNEINALLLKNGKHDAKTDRPSVGIEGSTAYWCGRADALAEVVGHCFAREAPCK